MHRIDLDQSLELGVVEIPVSRLMAVRDDQDLCRIVHLPLETVQIRNSRRLVARNYALIHIAVVHVVMAAVPSVLRPLIGLEGDKLVRFVILLGRALNIPLISLRHHQVVTRQRYEIQESNVPRVAHVPVGRAGAVRVTLVAVEFAPKHVRVVRTNQIDRIRPAAQPSGRIFHLEHKRSLAVFGENQPVEVKDRPVRPCRSRLGDLFAVKP